jgi:hypothetical protein
LTDQLADAGKVFSLGLEAVLSTLNPNVLFSSSLLLSILELSDTKVYEP